MTDARSDFEEASVASVKREEKEPHGGPGYVHPVNDGPEFDGVPLFESAHREDGQPQPNSLKETVAAHQAECFCHPAEASCDDDVSVCKTQGLQVARDSSGQPWHVDPLCKVRPEARA